MPRLALAALVAGFALAGPARAQDGPPREPGPFRPPDLVEVAALDPSFKVEVRYATADNFVGRPVYPVGRVFLQRPAAKALLRAQRALRRRGYGLLLFDGYRPWSVTRLFWQVVPPGQRAFVADPAVGSRHNRGCAVDLTLFDLASGREVEMPSRYDAFDASAAPDYAGGTPEQRARRDLLRATLAAEGFSVDPAEWWHFNHRDWRAYPILDIPLEQLVGRR
jgi:D-alanyl-D-alanine dipeptidase